MEINTEQTDDLVRLSEAARLRGESLQWLWNKVIAGKIAVIERYGVKLVRLSDVMSLEKKNRYNRKNNCEVDK